MNTNKLLRRLGIIKMLLLAFVLALPCTVHAWEWTDDGDGYGDGGYEYPDVGEDPYDNECPYCGSYSCDGYCDDPEPCSNCGESYCSGNCDSYGCDYCGDPECAGDCEDWMDEDWWNFAEEHYRLDASGRHIDSAGNDVIYPDDGVALSQSYTGANSIGFCRVDEYGQLEPVVNEHNWDILVSARADGFERVADILHKSVEEHEWQHIGDAILRNPVLDGFCGDSPLPEGATLVSATYLTNSREISAHDAQLDFLQNIIDSGSYNGETLTNEEIKRLEAGKNDVESMASVYKHPVTTP